MYIYSVYTYSSLYKLASGVLPAGEGRTGLRAPRGESENQSAQNADHKCDDEQAFELVLPEPRFDVPHDIVQSPNDVF